MNSENPFTITFGKQPNKLIARYEDTDKIVSTFSANNLVSQSYLIEGIRGSGKTVLMTTVANQLAMHKDWIIINLNPSMDLLANFAIRLNSACNPKNEFIKKGFSFSSAGFGIGINGEDKNTDYVGMIEESFKIIIKRKKRVLITIDEAQHDENMKIFASQFQIFVRQDYPIFLIMTGLIENIFEIQNDPALTFLLISPKIQTGPLSLLQIKKQYKNIFSINENDAGELANLTKGYAFAFQALGVSYWEHKSLEKALDEYDNLLDDFVYKKIWASLTSKEREIIWAISGEVISSGDVCKKISMNPSSFSRYREKLLFKKIIYTPKYGFISLSLPRFYEIVKNYEL